jgi:hypothetical protein
MRPQNLNVSPPVARPGNSQDRAAGIGDGWFRGRFGGKGAP